MSRIYWQDALWIASIEVGLPCLYLPPRRQSRAGARSSGVGGGGHQQLDYFPDYGNGGHDVKHANPFLDRIGDVRVLFAEDPARTDDGISPRPSARESTPQSAPPIHACGCCLYGRALTCLRWAPCGSQGLCERAGFGRGIFLPQRCNRSWAYNISAPPPLCHIRRSPTNWWW